MPTHATRVCKHCGADKPLTEYTIRKESGRPRAECNVCRYNGEQRRRWKRYGTSAEEYARLLLEQGGVCAICGRDPELRHLSIDHDHVTGRIRGLLCRWCNMGIGSFRERIDLMEKAIAYIRR